MMNYNFKKDTKAALEFVKEIQDKLPQYNVNISNVNDFDLMLTEREKCRKCIGLSHCQNTNQGFSTVYENDEFVLKECKFKREYRLQNNKNSLIKTLYLPNTVLNARLENKISNVQALNAKNTIIDQIIDLYDQKQDKLENAVATYNARADYLFRSFSSDIQNKINNGSLDISVITDETLANNIEEYYKYIEAASQASVEAEELKKSIADLAKQKFDNISTAYQNEIGLVDSYIDALQNQIDATEARGEQVGASYYESMIDNAAERKKSLEEERDALQASLDEAVRLGQVEVNSASIIALSTS